MILDQYGHPLFRADGYYNDQTGYGGANDQINNTRYLTDTPLSEVELEAMYFGFFVVRRGVEIPVNDRLSNGIQFLTNDDDSESRKKEVKALENDFRESDALNHLITGEYWARLYGGGLLYFDFGDEQPIRRTSLSVDGLNQNTSLSFELPDAMRGVPNKIWVVDRWRATPMSYYTERIHGPDHPKLGEPETYSVTLQTTGWSRLIFAHESRVVKIDGLPLPPRMKAEQHMWGASVVQGANEITKQFGVSLKAMADTLEDFNWKSLQIEGLADIIASNTQGDYELLTKMAALAAKNYHNQNIGLHAEGTELKKHTTTITGLPDMVDRFSNLVASAFHPGIPDSKFFAAKGGALAGTAAETDVRNYYKALGHLQESCDRPHIEKIIWLLGRDPDSFPFVFNAMEQATEMEKIEARDKQADVDGKYVGMGALAPQEVRASRFSTPETNLEQTIIDPELDEMLEMDEDDMDKEGEEEEEIITDVDTGEEEEGQNNEIE